MVCAAGEGVFLGALVGWALQGGLGSGGLNTPCGVSIGGHRAALWEEGGVLCIVSADNQLRECSYLVVLRVVHLSCDQRSGSYW